MGVNVCQRVWQQHQNSTTQCCSNKWSYVDICKEKLMPLTWHCSSGGMLMLPCDSQRCCCSCGGCAGLIDRQKSAIAESCRRQHSHLHKQQYFIADIILNELNLSALAAVADCCAVQWFVAVAVAVARSMANVVVIIVANKNICSYNMNC